MKYFLLNGFLCLLGVNLLSLYLLLFQEGLELPDFIFSLIALYTLVTLSFSIHYWLKWEKE